MSTATRRAGIFFSALTTCWLGRSAEALATQTIGVNGTGTGKTYEGIGAVSGGGGTSVLLHDYVEPQRTEILDYLFKPNYGAGLQELYVEIGGDGNSTQGSEPSHMHTGTDENYNRGHEWWLMEQAKLRNAAIHLDATAWSEPGWVGGGNYWSQGTATYLAKWIQGAKSAHDLDIDYVGCRNEWGTNTSWIQLFRTTLNGAGLTGTRIHGFDNWGDTWGWATAIATDPKLSAAVYAVSNHTTVSTPPPAGVEALGKPLWDTEEHVYEHGFQCAIDIVKAFNFNYINSKITKTIFWYLISAFYPNEPFYDVTMAVASTPWSGAYTVNPALWAYAHVGQFTQTGWRYLDAASGNFTGGGSYVTLVSQNAKDYSVIAQTEGATATQTITFDVSGGLSTGTVSVWRSDANAQFVQQPSVTPVNGTFTVAMEANAIYSITTTTGQHKGAATSPPAAAFPFPYYENYDHYSNFAAVGYRPYYHADIAATFELAQRPDNTGQCLQQVIAQPAQAWAPETNPYTVVGDTTWTDYQLSADVSVTGTGWASVMGRVNSTGNGFGTNPNGYYLTLSPSGAWSFYAAPNKTAIKTGQATLAAGDWHNVKLVFQGSTIRGAVDATQVFSITDKTWSTGSVGLGTAPGTTAYFDNLIVNTVNGATPAPTMFPQDGENAVDAGAPDAGGSTSSGSSSGAEASSSGGAGGASGSGGSVNGTGANGSGTNGAGGSVSLGGSGGTGGSPTGSGSPKGCSCLVGGSDGGSDGARGVLLVGAALVACGGRRRRAARRG